MTRFFLVRHGETEWNRLRKIQGISDIPLNDTGRSQAAALGDILSKHRFDLIVSSPLSRALETAQIVARKLGMPAPLVIQDLVERNYGEAEGSSGLELDTLYPPGTEIPGREDRADVTKRVVRTLHDLAIRHPEADILAVAHGAVIRCVVDYAAPGEYSEPITNCSVHSFSHVAGSLELVAFDDPMEVLSHELADDEFIDQNPAEARERARG
ncbi:MAG: histidine phosphatase family protein [Pontimonas sp.]|jgi:probable phosphoglycerate mutase|nr:histidine phosphatase family protein [Pontimonas sp.]MDP4816410.1 histidine phosphatase family protein [Pontimonas sp.]MDP5129217.1 histidine phosphatase family protein [Pontimonas sp.]